MVMLLRMLCVGFAARFRRNIGFRNFAVELAFGQLADKRFGALRESVERGDFLGFERRKFM